VLRLESGSGGLGTSEKRRNMEGLRIELRIGCWVGPNVGDDLPSDQL